jgi:hypothetical protein
MVRRVSRYFAGIDWSERHHDIAVIDADGAVVCASPRQR